MERIDQDIVSESLLKRLAEFFLDRVNRSPTAAVGDKILSKAAEMLLQDWEDEKLADHQKKQLLSAASRTLAAEFRSGKDFPGEEKKALVKETAKHIKNHILRSSGASDDKLAILDYLLKKWNCSDKSAQVKAILAASSDDEQK